MFARALCRLPLMAGKLIFNRNITMISGSLLFINRSMKCAPKMLLMTKNVLPVMSQTVRLSSTMKKRRMKMNKHKLKKKRKLMRFNTKQSRN